MATPASRFRPNGPTHLGTRPDASPGPVEAGRPGDTLAVVEVIAPPALSAVPDGDGAAVEFEVRVPPSGNLTVRSGRQQISLHESMAGRTVTVWADLRSVHLSSDGHVIRTVASRLRPEDLRHVAMRGARPAGPPPAVPALRRRTGTPPITAGAAVELERTVTGDGTVTLAGTRHLIGTRWGGRRIALRLDGHLMHAIADNALIGTWTCPVPADRLTGLHGARTPSTLLPPKPLPAGSLRAQRKVHASGRIMVAKQWIKLGPRHTGKLVTRRHRGHPPARPARRGGDRRPTPTRPHPDHPTPRHRRRRQAETSSAT